jgi:hypothetical protein
VKGHGLARKTQSGATCSSIMVSKSRTFDMARSFHEFTKPPFRQFIGADLDRSAKLLQAASLQPE